MEHISTTTLIVTLLIMVVISAYFSGSETGMMTLNRYRLRHRAKQGNRQAKRVEKLLRKPDRLISLVLIGNNLVNILASALGTIVGMRLYGDAGVAIATGVLTFVVLVFAEVLPKTIAALYPEKVAYPSSVLLAPLQILMMPLVWLLNTITRLLMRMMGIKTDIVVSGSLSKDELRTLVNESRSQISRRNQDMLLSVLDLEKVSVDDIMIPRNEIIGIDINDDWKSIVRQLSHSPHGRIVLYRDSLDDAISMLRVREAWRLMAEKKSSPKRPCYAPPTKFITFRKARHSAPSSLNFSVIRRKWAWSSMNMVIFRDWLRSRISWKRLLVTSRPQCHRRLPKKSHHRMTVR